MQFFNTTNLREIDNGVKGVKLSSIAIRFQDFFK